MLFGMVLRRFRVSTNNLWFRFCPRNINKKTFSYVNWNCRSTSQIFLDFKLKISSTLDRAWHKQARSSVELIFNLNSSWLLLALASFGLLLLAFACFGLLWLLWLLALSVKNRRKSNQNSNKNRWKIIQNSNKIAKKSKKVPKSAQERHKGRGTQAATALGAVLGRSWDALGTPRARPRPSKTQPRAPNFEPEAFFCTFFCIFFPCRFWHPFLEPKTLQKLIAKP